MALASALVSVMIDAVRKTARPMLRDFGEVAQLQVSRKGPGDFVTAADIKAEDTLFELLMKARPGYGFLGEERGLIEGTDKSHMWIVDPIDGTTNFMHAMPHFAITVGLQRTAPDGSSESSAMSFAGPHFGANRERGAPRAALSATCAAEGITTFETASPNWCRSTVSTAS